MPITQAQDTATSKLNEFRQLQERYQQADRAIAKKTAHLHVLQNLQAKFEGFAEGAKSILSGGLGEIVNESSVAIISKAIRVPQEYTLGLQTLLGMAVDALYAINRSHYSRTQRKTTRELFAIDEPSTVG